MNVKDIKQKNFPVHSIEDWEEAVKQSLKGRGISTKDTYENIALKPLYTVEDIDQTKIEQIPGTGFHTRGFDELGRKQYGWKIAQQIKKSSWEDLYPMLQNFMQRGQETIVFDVDQVDDFDQINFFDLKGIEFRKVPLFLPTKNHFKGLLEKLLRHPEKENINGFVGTDIISRKIAKGDIVNLDDRELNEWIIQIKQADNEFPKLKTILIDTAPYHNAGANAIQEIAIALAESIFYIESLKDEQWEPERIAEKLVFHFSIGANFFMEIAKLRAFRRLWSTVANAYQLPKEYQHVTTSAETSSLTKSILDPYVNLLRAGNEAFAAVIGGIDFLHVAAFDEAYAESNEFSARIARNIQWILREEAHLSKVIDPAGGSYYIESLTNEIASKAWELFQLIDAKGGIIDVLKSDWIQDEINQVLEKRQNAIATGKQSLIGTNVYVNLAEPITFPAEFHKHNANTSVNRLSEPFERLRKKSYQLEQMGVSPHAGMICLGPLKDHKARADFATGFLASGGIKATWSKECMNIDDMQTFMRETNYPYYCVCGNDEVYQLFLGKYETWFSKNNRKPIIDIVGNITTEVFSQLKNKGISGSINKNQNRIEKLTALLSLWEVE
ncbi:methylmalonyl-CoA mutase family protein [Heyndrickxia sp. FSL K6-6286]|uniref:methylmalonyl-CoA mutase family protein n=1 Tax=Heyndrickxia TaxID=2837504 RepID=UPI000A4E1E0B